MRNFSKHCEDGVMYKRIVLGIVLVIGMSGIAGSATFDIYPDSTCLYRSIAVTLSSENSDNPDEPNIAPMIINCQGSPGYPHAACLQLPWGWSSAVLIYSE